MAASRYPWPRAEQRRTRTPAAQPTVPYSAIGSPRAPVELHVHAMTDMTMHPANIRHSA